MLLRQTHRLRRWCATVPTDPQTSPGPQRRSVAACPSRRHCTQSQSCHPLLLAGQRARLGSGPRWISTVGRWGGGGRGAEGLKAGGVSAADGAASGVGDQDPASAGFWWSGRAAGVNDGIGRSRPRPAHSIGCHWHGASAGVQVLRCFPLQPAERYMKECNRWWNVGRWPSCSPSLLERLVMSCGHLARRSEPPKHSRHWVHAASRTGIGGTR